MCRLLIFVAEERNTKVSVLQRPHLLMVSGEDQEISIGNNIPVLVGARGDGASTNALVISQNVERFDVGMRMRLSATVGQKGPVRLEVELEQTQLVSSLAGDVTQAGPTIQTRTLNATVYLSDGATALIGGLASPNTFSVASRVPYLIILSLSLTFFLSHPSGMSSLILTCSWPGKRRWTNHSL